MNKTQKGFAAFEGLLIFIIITVIAGVGWYAIHTKHQTDKILNQAEKISQDTPSPKETGANQSKTVLTYKDSTNTFSLKYPKDSSIETPKDENSQTFSLATITFKDGYKLSVSNKLGGRGIPYDCSYDDSTGKTTWTGPSSGPCPYLVISDELQLQATGYDDKGDIQHVYLVDNNYTTYNDSGQPSTDRSTCLVLGPVASVGKKVYGLTFVDESLSTFTHNGKGLDSFINGCTTVGRNSSSDYFNQPGIHEAKAVLATFSFER